MLQPRVYVDIAPPPTLSPPEAKEVRPSVVIIDMGYAEEEDTSTVTTLDIEDLDDCPT